MFGYIVASLGLNDADIGVLLSPSLCSIVLLSMILSLADGSIELLLPYLVCYELLLDILAFVLERCNLIK